MSGMGVSWLFIILANVTGNDHHFAHHQLHHPSLAALPGVLIAWQLMTVSMMGPSCLPAARYVAMNTPQPARTVPMFLLGYLLLWSGFLTAAAISDTLLRRSMSTDDWLGQHPTTLLTGAAAHHGSLATDPAQTCLPSQLPNRARIPGQRSPSRPEHPALRRPPRPGLSRLLRPDDAHHAHYQQLAPTLDGRTNYFKNTRNRSTPGCAHRHHLRRARSHALPLQLMSGGLCQAIVMIVQYPQYAG